MSVRPVGSDVSVSRSDAARPGATPLQRRVQANYADGFEPTGHEGQVKRLTTQDLGRKLMHSPLYKKLPAAARAAFERALPKLSEPSAMVALMGKLKSEAFQKLPAAEQEKTFTAALAAYR